MSSEPLPVQLPFVAMECAIYHHPLFRIVSGGNNPAEDSIQIRCRHCKGQHTITRRKLDKAWEELRNPLEEAKEATPVQQDIPLT